MGAGYRVLPTDATCRIRMNKVVIIMPTSSSDYRLSHALNVIDAKKAAVRMLRVELDRSEMTLTNLQNRESYLECKLEAAETDIKKFKSEIKSQKGR